jgi:hypothetical protein
MVSTSVGDRQEIISCGVGSQHKSGMQISTASGSERSFRMSTILKLRSLPLAVLILARFSPTK